MRQYLIGLAAAAAVAVVSAPAMAGCGGCGPAISFPSFSNCSPCGGGFGGYGGGYAGGWGYATLAAPAQYYAVQVQAQPQYYFVNQGPTYTGPGMFAPVASYAPRIATGYGQGFDGYTGYNGGPYANPMHHMNYGAPAVSTPTVYSYRRAYRPYYRPAVRYGYGHRVWATPRVMYAPRHSFRYGYRAAPRYSVAPHQYGPRVLRRYY
jgi:hypothetical protein